MEGETKGNDLACLIADIKASDVLECRLSLISQLGNFSPPGSSDHALLLEHLVEFWDDSPCLGLSQCMLNQRILNIASKYLVTDTFCYPSQLLLLGTKATKWCESLFLTTLKSIGGSEDENHSSKFSQVILDSLSLSSSILFAMTRSPVLEEKVMIIIIQDFISQSLSLTKALIMQTKKIPSISSEILKLAQVILDSSVKFCRTYFQAINWNSDEIDNNVNKGMIEEEWDYASYVINIIACTIKYMYELGMFAASGGGSLVTLLNVSWKGVVSLLQLAKGSLSEKTNVTDIILNLISLAIESLRYASEAWSVLNGTLTNVEAKRTFLPIKFYLINAVRISSEYSLEAIVIQKEISRCAFLISSLGISFSKETKFRAASEALAEFLEPTSLLLLHTLLNAANIKLESRLLIFDWLFHDANNSESVVAENINSVKSNSLESIFLVSCDDIPTARDAEIGRVILFLSLLKTSSVLKEEILIGISGKLEFLLHMLMHEEVYSLALGMEIPLCSGFGSGSGVTWQPIFHFTLHSLKTFMIVAGSSSPLWMEVEAFLVRNICHPHPLCLEIITEMLCFLLRHGEMDMINHMLDRICSILKIVASSELDFRSLSALRKMSRLVCVLLSYVPPASVDRLYNLIIRDNSSEVSQIMFLSLLMESFPFDSLSYDSKLLAVQNLVTSFYHFVESKTNEQELILKVHSESCNTSFLGLPVHAISSALRCSQVKVSDICRDKKITKSVSLAILIINAYKNATNVNKELLGKLLSAALDIISSTSNLYDYSEMGKLILELHTCFVQCAEDPLYQCKPSIASFMASLSHMEIAEDEGQILCRAIWDLHHMLLRERHWAIVHLSLVAFGYFAGRTSCTQLWRFVPNDATLSFDTSTGTRSSIDSFMSELKCVLEKELPLGDTTLLKEQSVLVQEGLMLRKIAKLLNSKPQVSDSRQTLMNDKNSVSNNKKRKFFHSFSEGMELIQRGLKVMNNALAQPDATDLEEFSSHISCLEDVISHLVCLKDKA